MYTDISMIIQGPINNSNKLDFKQEIHQYKNLFPEIILSTYLEHLNKEIIDFCSEHNIKIVAQTINIDDRLKIKYNVGYQMISSINGIKLSTNKYTLKHRTDEKYSNINKLVDKFLLDDEKWVTGSMFLISTHRYYFCMSDHLAIAKKEKMEKVYELTLKNIYDNTYERNTDNEPASELTITRNVIRINGEEPINSRHDELIEKYFDFINDREMYPFMIRCNHGNMHLTECHQLDPTLSGINDIKLAINRNGGW